MAHTGYPILVPQDFIGLNFGGVFTPSARSAGPAQNLALLATPFQGPMHVHSVPTHYVQPKQPATTGGNVSLDALMGRL